MKLKEMLKELCPDGVEYKKLSDICLSLPKKALKQEELFQDGFPVVNGGCGLYGYYSVYNNEPNAICVASRGQAGYVSYWDCKFWAGALCYPYRSKDENEVLTKFVFYALKNSESTIMEKLVAKGSIPALNKCDLDSFEIPIPPLPIQQEIVRILDNLTELHTKLKAELEAELEAREKQYEYYREKILSFEDLLF